MSDRYESPRVRLLEPDTVSDEETRAVFDAFIRDRGKVPHLFRAMAARPAITATLAAHMRAVMGPGEVPTLLKELVSIRVSRINNCEY